MRVLLWYAHGSYVNALVQGTHDYLVCIDGPSGRDVPRPTRPWPSGVQLSSVDEVAADPPDVVVVQRLEEIELCRDILGFEPGRDRPAVFLEHNLPRREVPATAHPLSDHDRWLVVHVTHVNSLLWDCGRTATVVVPHGVPDPGPRYLGELDRAAFVANEPLRRSRVVGADLVPVVVPHDPGRGRGRVDVFGIDGDLLVQAWPHAGLRWGGNLAQDELWDAVARDRVYLHLNRWTSLGLSLIEAMLMGMPVAVLAMTEAATLPAEIGAVSADPSRLRRRVAELMGDAEEARRCGAAAREVALERHGLDRFLAAWDSALDRAVELHRSAGRVTG